MIGTVGHYLGCRRLDLFASNNQLRSLAHQNSVQFKVNFWSTFIIAKLPLFYHVSKHLNDFIWSVDKAIDLVSSCLVNSNFEANFYFYIIIVIFGYGYISIGTTTARLRSCLLSVHSNFLSPYCWCFCNHQKFLWTLTLNLSINYISSVSDLQSTILQ